MALKNAKSYVEVKHIIIADEPQNLDTQLANNWMNLGWEILEAKLIMYDAYNHIMQVFYILGRPKPNA